MEIMATFFLAPTTDKRMSCLVRTYKNQKNQYYLIQLCIANENIP